MAARQQPWPKRTLAEIRYWENIVPCDLDGDGVLDLVLGDWWLENLGDGTFRPHRIAEDFIPARLAVADINGNGRSDVVVGEQGESEAGFFSRLAWFEQPEDARSGSWEMHVIDRVRYPHSIDVADLDGDGEKEIVCGEHDPTNPYSGGCRLLIYKKEADGRAWRRHVLDDRFEHHVGTKILEVSPGRAGIISHGCTDGRYVHLWESY